MQHGASPADHAALAIGNARSYAAERAARDAAEKATALFSRLSDAGLIGIAVSSLASGAITFINDTLLGIVGCSREEVSSGRVEWASLTPPEWRHVDEQAVEQLKTTGVTTLREKEYQRGGRRVPVLAGSAMAGTDTCVSFVLDMTARKEAERARHEAERRSQRIVDSATVGLWTLDAQGKTTSMNPPDGENLGARPRRCRSHSVEGVLPSRGQAGHS